MLNKKLMILAIFFVSLLAVSAVSAADNATEDIVNVEETDEVVSISNNDVNNNDSSIENDYVISVEGQNIDEVGVTEENELSESEGTFADLAKDINDVDGEFNLTKDYVCSEDDDSISIEKEIIINGNGFSINGNNNGKSAFIVSNNYVVLKNIKFKNYSINTIMWYGANGILENCTFNNCYYTNSDRINGVVIYWNGNGGKLLNCSFKDCYSLNAKFIGGGVIYWNGNDGNLSDCSFKDCSAYSSVKLSGNSGVSGGAVYWSGANGRIFGCNFDNCQALLRSDSGGAWASGGAVNWYGEDGKIFNCSFVNCLSKKDGGAIYWNHYGGTVSDSSFVNCTVSPFSTSEGYGHAIRWYGDDGRVYGCNFKNCFVSDSQNSHNTIYWSSGEGGVITNNYFDPYYNSIGSQIYVLIINKIDVMISCNDVSFAYMEDNDFKLCLTDYFGRNLSNREIIFENKVLGLSKSILTDNNGFATLPVEFTKNAGNYNITITFNGDDNYYSKQNVFNLNIDPLDSSVIVNNCTGVVGQDTSLTVNVVCSNGVTITEGEVTFFDGETNIGKSNVMNGVATLEYVPTTSGKHTIKAIYSSNNYNSSNNTFILTVSNANIDLNINVETVYFSNPSNFVINVNSNSREVNEGRIKFYVNNVFINTSDVNNGVASLNYVMDTAGSFNLSVVYDETDNYFGKNASKIFYVDKMPTALSGETTFFDEEQSRIFTVNLKDDKGDGVNSQTVKVEVVKFSGESKTLTNVTDENGVAIFDVGNLAGGMWIVRGIFDENNNYQGSLFTDKFIVIRMNTTTTIDEIKDSHKGYPIQLHANILDEFGVWITDGIAHFYVDGKDCGYIDYSSKRIFPYKSENKQILRASISDFDNQLGATVADSSNLYLEYLPTEGTHTINVVYEGTSLYRPSNHTTTFEVQDGAVPTTLVATNINTIYNGGGYLVATLKDAWGKPIPNVKISINVKGVKYLTTDKNGQVKFSTNGLAPKSYIATITFAGNNNYVKSTATAKVTVIKATPKLTAKAKTFKKSVKTKKYTVTLKDNAGKVIKNMKLTIKVNKKTYTTKTNTKGKATFKIKKLTKKGKYVATVTFKGNACYNKVAKKVKIVVK